VPDPWSCHIGNRNGRFGVHAETTVTQAELLGSSQSSTPVGQICAAGAVKVTDGPVGARGDGEIGAGTPALVLPCPTALAATWAPDLVAEAATDVSLRRTVARGGVTTLTTAFDPARVVGEILKDIEATMANPTSGVVA
jgi:hypothetical protein